MRCLKQAFSSGVLVLSLLGVCLSLAGLSLLPCHTGHPGSSLLSSTPVRSLLDCATRCGLQPRCDVIHFYADVRENQCMTSELAEDSIWSSSELGSSCVCYEKLCQNGGVENLDGSCGCVNGYVGERCQELTEDCLELYGRNPSAVIGVYLIHPKNSPHPFPIHCGGGGRMLMSNRDVNSMDFNRTWEDYAEGFGNLDSWGVNLWRGLRYWHYLTSSRDYHLSIHIRDTQGWLYTIFLQNFRVRDEASNFTVTFKLATGNLTSDQPSFNGSQFSTFDRDQDSSPSTHCAQLHGGGWWFTDCGDSNPTGPLLSTPGGRRLGIPAEAFWEGTMGNKSIGTIWMSLVP